MNLKKILLLLAATTGISVAGTVYGQSRKHATGTNYPTYQNLIMAGYQGWFRGPDRNFGHYGTGGKFDEQHCKIDAWPDVSDYEKTYETSFVHADGTKAKVFSSTDKSTTDLHFKWMREYGIDGVFIQRFFGSTKRWDINAPENVVLKNAFQAASDNNRAIAIMYDLSGLGASGEDCSSIIEDWKQLIDQLNVTNQAGTKTYLHHNGKPVVAIWGIGFPDRPYNIRNIGLERLFDFLKNDPVYGGCSIMIGVPTAWRTLDSDCINDPYLHTIIKQSDIVLPWTVQRFTPLLHNDMDRFRDLIINDMTWCRDNGLDYVPCVTPGFSWHNLSKGEFPDDIKPVGSIPRRQGKFLWQQFSTAMIAGARMIYVAMFDEVDEGTAIFKCSDNPPVSNVAKFIDMEGMPADHYMWLTGEAAKMLKKQKPLSIKMPVRK